jgi:putative sugar O-methyltransferase
MRNHFAKKQAKLQKYLNIHLWGAPGLRHYLVGAPKPKIEFASTSFYQSEELVERIVFNYQRTITDFPEEYVRWDEVSDLRRSLENKDKPRVQNILEHMFKNEIVHHFGHHEGMYQGPRVWRQGFQELRITDMLLSLGEALSVINLPNHAQMKLKEYADFINIDQNKLFSKIEDALEFSLEVPMIGFPPSVRLNNVRTSADMIRHAYIVHRMKKIGLKSDEPILEIGAGYGSQAFLAHRAGFTDYTIIDLPVVNAIQTFFLGCAIGFDQVSGYGEDKKSFHILPTGAIGQVPDSSIALSVNMDSMAEWSHDVTVGYLRHIRRFAKKFLHINQEAQQFDPITKWKQGVVFDCIGEVSGYEQIYRFPYWMMEGYVEELYDIKDS